MSKFTEGPWEQDEEAHVYAKNLLVANCEHAHFVAEVRDANAKLIAAAPELLEALILCVSLIESMQRQLGQDFSNEELADAYAAIAKAKN